MGSIAVDIAPGNEYKLSRGGREAVRLTAQHHTLIARQGYLLHPTIAAAVKDIARPRIADVASGTGIWALDIARAMPHADIIGLDISDAQYPPSWTIPSNVTFDIYDLLQDVPASLQGSFDIVHVRLLLAAGPAVDKQVFIDRFRSLLLPGGWLQWEELNYPSMIACIPTTTSTTSTTSTAKTTTIDTITLETYPAVLAMAKYLALDTRVGWTADSVAVLTAAGGYDRIERHPAPLRPYLMRTETDLNLVVVTDILEQFLVRNRAGGDNHPAVACEVRDAIAKMQTDVENGVLFAYCWNVCVARKV